MIGMTIHVIFIGAMTAWRFKSAVFECCCAAADLDTELSETEDETQLALRKR